MLRPVLLAALVFGVVVDGHANDRSTAPAATEEHELSDLVAYLASDTIRETYPLLKMEPAPVHVAGPFQNESVEDGIKAVFQSYPEAVPAGISILVTTYGGSGRLSSAVYDCPSSAAPCTYDPSVPLRDPTAAESSAASSHSTESRRLGAPDVFRIKAEGDYRLEGKIRAIYRDVPRELELICLNVEIIRKRFFGLSEAKPEPYGQVCYDVTLDLTVTSTLESTFGYKLGTAEKNQLQAEFEALIGVPANLN